MIFFLKVCASLAVLIAIWFVVGMVKDYYDRYGWPRWAIPFVLWLRRHS